MHKAKNRKHPHRVYRRPDDSRVATKHGKKMEFIKNDREVLYGPVQACKCLKGGRVCGNLFRSADPDEQFCSECLYTLYILPDWGGKDVTVHHPFYD